LVVGDHLFDGSGRCFLGCNLARKRPNFFGGQRPVLMLRDLNVSFGLQSFRNGRSADAKTLGDSGLTNSLDQFW